MANKSKKRYGNIEKADYIESKRGGKSLSIEWSRSLNT